MIEVTSRHMECTLLTSNYSQMPAVALHLYSTPKLLLIGNKEVEISSDKSKD